MSTSTPRPLPSSNSPADSLRETAERAASSALRPVRALGFWTAVALPFVVLALLTVGVLSTPLTLGALLVVEPAALVAGHDYAREDAES